MGSGVVRQRLNGLGESLTSVALNIVESISFLPKGVYEYLQRQIIETAHAGNIIAIMIGLVKSWS